MPLVSIEEFEKELALAQSAQEEETEEIKPVPRTTATTNRHSTAIYQMLERIENKVLANQNNDFIMFIFLFKIKAEEHQNQFGFDDIIEKIQKTTGASDIDEICAAGNGVKDLWVDKYRPQKFTQLITMDVSTLISSRLYK